VAGARAILHATDFSPASRGALQRAIGLARRRRSRLLVLHVLTPPSPFARDGRAAASYLELLFGARTAARRRLAETVARARRVGVAVAGRVVEGVPAEEIVRAARRGRAEAIVIGTHGRTGFRRLLMGSVAERVLQLSRCPVLTVRTR